MPPGNSVDQPERFNRYYFPLTGTRAEQGFFSVKNGAEKSTTNAIPPPTVVGTSPTTAPLFLEPQGQSNLQTFLGHYDVTTTWNIDDPSVDTTQYSPQLGYTRMQYSTIPYGVRPENLIKTGTVVHQLSGAETASLARQRSPTEPRQDGEFTVGGPVVSKLSSLAVGDVLEIKEICKWAVNIHPRDVTDFKPLFILVQGLLKDVLDEKYKFFSQENGLLRAQMREMEDDYERHLADSEREIEELRKEVGKEKETAQVQLMFQSTLTRMKSIAKNTKTEAEREVIITNLKEREVNEENLKRNLKEARMELDKAVMSNQQMQLQLRRAEEERIALEAVTAKAEDRLRDLQNDTDELVRLCAQQQDQLLSKQTFMKWAFRDRDIDHKFGDMLGGMSSAQEICQWMVSKGPIAAGLALEAFANGSAPHLQDELSDAFSQLDPQYAKEVLKTTSVATAGKVMAQLGDVHGAKMAKLLAEMPMYRAGAILGELDESAFESLMRSIGSVGDKKLNAMASARSQYKTAKKALRVAVASSEHQVTQSAESPHLSLQTAKSLKKAITLRKREVAGNLDEMATAMEEASKENAADFLEDVQLALSDAQAALIKLDPKVAAELLSGTASDVSAALLERMPANLAPRIIDQMASSARMVGKLRDEGVMEEIRAAIEKIKAAGDTEEMAVLIQMATDVIETRAGLALTVCQLEQDESDDESDSPPKGGKGDGDDEDLLGPGGDDDSYLGPDLMPSAEIVATCEFDPARGRSATSTGEPESPPHRGKRRTVEGESSAASAGSAEGSNGPFAEQLDGRLTNLLAVKNSQGLSNAQKYAIESKQLTVMHNHVAHPVFMLLGKKEVPYGVISSSGCGGHGAVSCPYCGRSGAAGDSAASSPAKTPEGMEIMTMLAQAIAETAGRLLEAENEELVKLEALMETASGILAINTSDIKELKKVKKVAEIYAGRVARRLRSSNFLRKQLAEIRRYAKPPKTVIRIISALLLILDQPRAKDNFGPQYALPEDKGIPKLWGWERTQLVIDRSNPLSLPPRMASEIKKDADHLSAEGKVRFKSARGMLDGVGHEDAKKASSAVAYLRKFVLSMLNANAVMLKMKELGY